MNHLNLRFHPTVKKALLVASVAHKAVNQKRKYSGKDYIVHPILVASTLMECVNECTPEMVAAAYLHDTVEDTGLTLEFIHRHFGIRVRDLVKGLTNISSIGDGNRDTRKRIDALHSAEQDAETQTIKVSDICCNLADIDEASTEYAKMFIAEKRYQLSLMTKADKNLKALAEQLMTNFEN